MALVSHGVTHRGRRGSNEDALLQAPDLGLFIVADGMGGHKAGEVAADLAVTTIHGTVRQGSVRNGGLLLQGVRAANDCILEAAAQNAEYAGMGTTVTAVLIQDTRIAFVSVGDSRMYRLRAGVLEQMTRDDSWVAHMQAAGIVTSDAEAERHPMRHVLTHVVGVSGDLQPTLYEDTLEAGDMLLLCSDGLYGALPADRISATLRDEDSDVAAERLVEQALARGASDNVTALVVAVL